MLYFTHNLKKKIFYVQKNCKFLKKSEYILNKHQAVSSPLCRRCQLSHQINDISKHEGCKQNMNSE